MYRESAEILKNAAVDCYFNSAALHDGAIKAEGLLEEARAVIAQRVGVRPEELYFTPSGTFADNAVIRGILSSKRGGRIITSAIEHPAVSEVFKGLEKDFEVVYLSPENGTVTAEALKDALTEDTRLVSIMHVNNETGAIMPIKELSALTHRAGALFHTDAVQGFMKEDFKYSCVDAASFSAHKTHGPKGVGAMYVKKGTKISPIIYGGGHENGLVSGTVPVPLITAWADAVKRTDTVADRARTAELKSYVAERITALGGEINSSANDSPYILSVIFRSHIGENLLHYLSQNGIYVSTGSACSSKHGSKVYGALGLADVSKNILRISFSSENDVSQADRFISVLGEGLEKISKIK